MSRRGPWICMAEISLGPAPPPVSATAALAALVPAPTADELIAKFNRFMLERAPTHPLEALTVAAFISGLAEGLAPALAQLREAVAAATPTPSAPDDVN